jgi:hypothetical protein
MAAPHQLPVDFFKLLICPMILKNMNGRYYVQPGSLWSGMPEDEKRIRFEALMCFYALSSRILGNFVPAPRM